MKNPFLVLLTVAFVVSAPERSKAQPNAAAPTHPVVLDVVVRDKEGQAVRTLTREDFEVFEDGKSQTLVDIQAVDEGTETPSTQVPEADPEAPDISSPTLIAFVFDRMSGGGREMALESARHFAEEGGATSVLAGVFVIDPSLTTLQHFTSDLDAVRNAFVRAAEPPDSLDETRELVQTAAVDLANDPVSTATPGDPTRRLTERMLRGFEALEGDQAGYSTTNGLLSVVQGLASMPGRKVVVFFAEGMAIPAKVQAQYRSVVSAANRANVSVSVVDAGGRRAKSAEGQDHGAIVAAADQATQNAMSDYSMSNNRPMSRSSTRTQDVSRPHLDLGLIAEETGGFLIRSPNDASKTFRRIEEDMRFHYVLTYSPSDARQDGRFRVTEVKVKKSGLKVRSGQGYFAVPSNRGSVVPVREFEAPALARLGQQPLPTDLPLYAGAFAFPEHDRPGLVSVIVEPLLSAVQYEPDKKKQNFSADLVVVARITDEEGREVQHMSEHYPLVAKAEDLATAREANLFFYREVDLAPGRYVLTTVAYDSLGEKAGTSSGSIEVTAASGMQMSSLVLVRRMEESEEQNPSRAPLLFDNVLLYPSLGQSFSRAASQRVVYFFSVLGASGRATASFELWKGEEKITGGSGPLPAADARGRIQYASTVPMSGLATGNYELRVKVKDGSGQTENRNVRLEVVP